MDYKNVVSRYRDDLEHEGRQMWNPIEVIADAQKSLTDTEDDPEYGRRHQLGDISFAVASEANAQGKKRKKKKIMMKSTMQVQVPHAIKQQKAVKTNGENRPFDYNQEYMKYAPQNHIRHDSHQMPSNRALSSNRKIKSARSGVQGQQMQKNQTQTFQTQSNQHSTKKQTIFSKGQQENKAPFSYNGTQIINSQSSERINRQVQKPPVQIKAKQFQQEQSIDRQQVMSQLMNIADEIVNKSFEKSGSKSKQRRVIQAIDRIASYLSTNTQGYLNGKEIETTIGSNQNPPSQLVAQVCSSGSKQGDLSASTNQNETRIQPSRVVYQQSEYQLQQENERLKNRINLLEEKIQQFNSIAREPSSSFQMKDNTVALDESVNSMLQSYSSLLSKIHQSVKTLGTRLEDIEQTKSKRVKHYKKKLHQANEKNRALAEQCSGLERDLHLAVNTLEKLRTDFMDTKLELDRFRSHYRDLHRAGNNESSKYVYDPNEEQHTSQVPPICDISNVSSKSCMDQNSSIGPADLKVILSEKSGLSSPQNLQLNNSAYYYHPYQNQAPLPAHRAGVYQEPPSSQKSNYNASNMTSQAHPFQRPESSQYHYQNQQQRINGYNVVQDFAATSMVSYMNPMLVAEDQRTEYQSNQESQLILPQENSMRPESGGLYFNYRSNMPSKQGMYSQQRSQSRLSNGQESYPQQIFLKNQNSPSNNTSQISRNHIYEKQSSMNQGQLQLVNSGKTMTFADDSQKIMKRPSTSQNRIEKEMIMEQPSYAQEDERVNSPEDYQQQQEESVPFSQKRESSSTRRKGSKMRKRIPKSKSSQNRNSPRQSKSSSSLHRTKKEFIYENPSQRISDYAAQQEVYQEDVISHDHSSQLIEDYAMREQQLNMSRPIREVPQTTQANHLSLMFLPSMNEASTRMQPFQQRRFSNIETPMNDNFHNEYFQNYSGQQTELPTPVYKNQDVLKHLKDEICSIDQEILELQSNLGLAINRRSYQASLSQ
ncbi:hypothetical protein FGO68_gene5933 [Halteria grandinella]|uniref:Uncharacterized protein n=1 Tax=Halteria grandinella TaxID=5974 RepID=A0A8J8T888_HALGN|nr:hypothetical protein FGO68_gene5933 [Halteria grandinella]